MWRDANELQTNINDKYEEKKTPDTLNYDHKGLGVDNYFSCTTNPQESHNTKSRPPKNEKKKIIYIYILRERERCPKCETGLEIYNKKMRIRRAKNKGDKGIEEERY